MKIIKIKGTMVIGRGMFSKGDTVDVAGVIAVPDNTCENNIARIIREHSVYLSCVHFARDGRLYTHLPHCTVIEAIEAADKEKSAFLKKLDKANLRIGDDDKLYIKSPKKVKHIVGNQLLSRKLIESLVLPEGKTFSYHWDNGYSYCGTKPVTKEKWLGSVDTILTHHFSFGEQGGVYISEASQYGECFAVNVCISDNKPYSEVSFS